MEADLTPLDVATHWPLLRHHLLLDRSPAYLAALDLLAERQVEAQGNPCYLGVGAIEAAGFTRGQTGRFRQVLRILEERGVVIRFAGSGRRPNLWSFTGSVQRWTGMPWRYSAREPVRAIAGCACRVACVVVACFPGQSVAGFGETEVFAVPEEFHLRRPGLLPVEVRDYDTSHATTTHRPGLFPVDNSDPAPPYCASKDLITPLHSEGRREEEEEKIATLLSAVSKATGRPVWGQPKKTIEHIAATSSAEIVALVAQAVSRQRDMPVTGIVEWAAALVRSPELLAEIRGPAGVVESAELRRLRSRAAACRLAGEEVPSEVARRIAELSPPSDTIEP